MYNTVRLRGVCWVAGSHGHCLSQNITHRIGWEFSTNGERSLYESVHVCGMKIDQGFLGVPAAVERSLSFMMLSNIVSNTSLFIHIFRYDGLYIIFMFVCKTLGVQNLNVKFTETSIRTVPDKLISSKHYSWLIVSDLCVFLVFI